MHEAGPASRLRPRCSFWGLLHPLPAAFGRGTGPGLILPGASAWWMRSSTRRDFWSQNTSIALQAAAFPAVGTVPWCQQPLGWLPSPGFGQKPVPHVNKQLPLQGEKRTEELIQQLPALTTNGMDLARASRPRAPALSPCCSSSAPPGAPSTQPPCTRCPPRKFSWGVFCPGAAPAAPDPHLSSSTSPASRGLAGEHEIWLELGRIPGDQPVHRAGGSRGFKFCTQTSPGGPHQTSSLGFLQMCVIAGP